MATGGSWLGRSLPFDLIPALFQSAVPSPRQPIGVHLWFPTLGTQCWQYLFTPQPIRPIFAWGLGQETAEKQAPSALEFLGQFRKAIELMKKNSGRQVPLAQCLGACIADYNRNTIHRKFKVDSWKRKIIHNLLKSPAEMVDLLAAHYDDHRHTSSGQAAPKLLKQASSEFASRCTLPYFLSTAVRNHLHYAAVFSPMSTCRHCHIHVFLSRSSSRLLRII